MTKLPLKKNKSRTIGQSHADYEDALLAIVAFIEEQNKLHGRPDRAAKINVHFLGEDVRKIYQIAKAALK